jgi:hypothetical protein
MPVIALARVALLLLISFARLAAAGGLGIVLRLGRGA